MNSFKKILLLALLLALAGGYYGYSEYNRKPIDLSTQKADISIAASDLIQAFSTDETKANEKFLDKNIAVTGNIKSIEKDEQGTVTILLGNDTDMNNVSCQLDERHAATAASLKQGDLVNIKGVCTGSLIDVVLVRCAIEKK